MQGHIWFCHQCQNAIYKFTVRLLLIYPGYKETKDTDMEYQH